MHDPELYITCAVSGLAGLAMLTTAGLSGWRGWLSLKQQELGRHSQSQIDAPALPSAASRIEMADLKERIRKLEAIAAGVDL
ncbi:hypothetical protein [Sphingomonas sp. S2-65]|uniref:hypothetical protein n=1 Tax=Sphingomonas sp. S2-65 TaxID=2903960 RepID=UPI001F38D236|nr:hypothetical protein [Sphingomonas sp. S2-65]UYY60205.1 hypothetical protein LZ586_01090 [Sphingomonas sp. S2-65]